MDKIIKAESVAHGNPKIDHYRGAVAACFYGGMSIATVFLNKAIFRVHKFHFPATLVAGQMAFTMFAIVVMQQIGILKKMHFSLAVLRKVGLLSFFFLLKLVLDMSALNTVNIPMYGVLKSSTTPCVLLLDYLMRGKSASSRIQASVWSITLGGLIAGIGDLTFHPVGYLLALSSAMSTAAYVVTVGKLGDEAKLDSFTLLFYNCCWSLPMSMVIMVCTGEWSTLATFPHLTRTSFWVCFSSSCASAFVLNWATYLCTLENDSLTTSVVGRTKSIFQTLGGLFAFGDVRIGVTNLVGVAVNSGGIGWYTYEKYLEHMARLSKLSNSRSEECLPLAERGELISPKTHSTGATARK